MTMINEEILIELHESTDYIQVVFSVKELLSHMGFDEIQQSLIASAASELSTNIIRYATCGTVLIRSITSGKKMGIEIIASDNGPGIKDINQALENHYSTGKGLGLGLPSVKRIMDDFEIQSATGQGTRVTVRKWRND
jgi:serine/threonine-protein kinase RsbT